MVVVRIKVFLGGSNGVNMTPFEDALAGILKGKKSTFEVEYLNTDQIKIQKLSPEQVFDWLLDSKYHFILSHVHQGITGGQYGAGINETTLKWSANEIIKHISKLKEHPGFPNGINLFCPLFLQHKLKWMKLMPQYCIPSLEVRFQESYTKEEVKVITNFLRKADNEEGKNKKFFVKSGFSTNGMGIKRAQGDKDVFRKIVLLDEHRGCWVDSCFIQPSLVNNYEQRVVCFNGEPQYLARIGPPKGKSFPVDVKKQKDKEQILFEIAKNAIQELKKCCPEVISNGIIRVDLMILANGEIVVNEFESLEANIYSKKDNHNIKGLNLTNKFWTSVIADVLSSEDDIYDGEQVIVRKGGKRKRN